MFVTQVTDRQIKGNAQIKQKVTKSLTGGNRLKRPQREAASGW
jgi:hypothetical protein